MCSLKDEYHIKEVEYLRSEYRELGKETRALEVYTLLAVGVIWSWCIAHKALIYTSFLIWLPVIVVILFGIRAFGVYMQMRTIKKYLLNFESAINDISSEIGWENFNNKRPFSIIWPITAYVYWASLSFLTTILPFVLIE